MTKLYTPIPTAIINPKHIKIQAVALIILSLMGQATLAQTSLRITEIFPGQAGSDLTADWFEIVNTGDETWISGLSENLYYDDESSDAGEATLVEGISEITPGSAAIIVVGTSNDAAVFYNIWSPVINLNNVQIGYTDGEGLDAGGDGVTFWIGDPATSNQIDWASYPDTEQFDGKSYDVTLASFSEVGNVNRAVQTTAQGGDSGNIPNIGSPGNMGPVQDDSDAPEIIVNPVHNTPFLNYSSDGPAYISGVINDPTDPASNIGIVFTISDSQTEASGLSVSASSSNQLVVPNGNLIIDGSDSLRTLTITGSGTGYSDITFSVADPDSNTDSYTIHFAASREAIHPATTHFHTGASDGSTAIATGDQLMWVADDEDQTLRLYHRNQSGYPLNLIEMTPSVGDAEIDLEGSFRVSDTIYWMGSHTEPDRSVAFSVLETGTGSGTGIAYLGQYAYLRDDVITWDSNDGHGKGAGFYGFDNQFEVEGLSVDPNNPGGALLALRSPLADGDAILIPVVNFQEIVSSEVAPNSAILGIPIELDLERHSFRSIDCNGYGCLILAGPFANITDFRLFTWSGKPADPPELRAADLKSVEFGNYEGIVGLPDAPFLGNAGDTHLVQLVIDMGSFDLYGDGAEANDLSNNEWKKFASETVILGEIVIPPAAMEGDIVINEIMQNPSIVPDTAGEWFELFNSTFASIDINGWIISDAGTDIDTIDHGESLIIPAGGYLVLGVNANLAGNGNVIVDYEYDAGFALANGADELILRASDGTLVDSIAWDGGTVWPDPEGASMSLLNPNLDNNDGSIWCVSVTAFGDGDFGTPSTDNDCALPPAYDLQITEAWVGQTTGSDLTADWFEITNFGDLSWVNGTDPNLYFDDESQDPNVADPINGISEILPGKSIIVVIGNESDVTIFRNIWSPDYNLDEVETGWTDGAGLGQEGDGVTLFVGTPSILTIVDFESFPAVPSGVSWDVVLGAFSQQGVGTTQLGTNVAVATTATNGVESAIGSPGNEGPVGTLTYDLKITEIFSGQAGADLTADWFEIVNEGNFSWIQGVDPVLYYEDESQDPVEATLIEGLISIEPGEAVVVVIGNQSDVTTFIDIWSPVITLSGSGVGYTDGAGLDAGGDHVVLWVGDPSESDPVDTAAYPDTGADDGKSYDISLMAFSEIGNANGAVQTIALGGDNGDVANIGSPGNGLAIAPNIDLVITEIFSGQEGDDLTADWFEIVNEGNTAWTQGIDPDLYYDDDSQEPSEATLIEGISQIDTGAIAIIVIGTEEDVATFIGVWGEVIVLNGVEIGFTDGAGLVPKGDLVIIWAGDPHLYAPVDTASYPDTEADDGKSYDVTLMAFSEVGNENGAVQTLAMGGDGGDVPNIASPGNMGATTGVYIPDISEFVNIFPNPGIGEFTISISEGHKLLNSTVYDITGQKVFFWDYQGSEFTATLDLKSLERGMYLLRLHLEQGIAVKRIIKE